MRVFAAHEALCVPLAMPLLRSMAWNRPLSPKQASYRPGFRLCAGTVRRAAVNNIGRFQDTLSVLCSKIAPCSRTDVEIRRVSQPGAAIDAVSAT